MVLINLARRRAGWVLVIMGDHPVMMVISCRAAKRGAAWQQCSLKEIDRTISSRRILVNYIIFVISFTNNG